MNTERQILYENVLSLDLLYQCILHTYNCERIAARGSRSNIIHLTVEYRMPRSINNAERFQLRLGNGRLRTVKLLAVEKHESSPMANSLLPSVLLTDQLYYVFLKLPYALENCEKPLTSANIIDYRYLENRGVYVKEACEYGTKWGLRYVT